MSAEQIFDEALKEFWGAMNLEKANKISLCIVVTILLNTSQVLAGNYTDSAHGNYPDGVNRSSISGYSIGNCSHCHEQHTSIFGSEPDPEADGVSSLFVLFTKNFNEMLVTGFHTANTSNPYSESDNICFYCHNSAGSVMQVENKTYAETFGNFTPSTPINSIYDAFGPILLNNHSHHNLVDVFTYANTAFSYFTDDSNPCVACHNPHRARRNKTDVDNPALTAISRPADHENLWGDDDTAPNERMDQYTYQAPNYSVGSTYEPGGTGFSDGSLVPDYNSFCLDCHANQVPTTNSGTVSAADSNVTPTPSNPTPSGYLTAINWGADGDIHGGAPRFSGNYSTTGSAILREPYDTTLGGTSPNYVLSCLDCHEPHGTVLYNVAGSARTYSSFLLRKEINGEEVICELNPGQLCSWGLDDADWTPLGLCRRCHDVSEHCGGQTDCFTCHYHGSTVNAGCSSGDAGINKAF